MIGKIAFDCKGESRNFHQGKGELYNIPIYIFVYIAITYYSILYSNNFFIHNKYIFSSKYHKTSRVLKKKMFYLIIYIMLIN